MAKALYSNVFGSLSSFAYQVIFFSFPSFPSFPFVLPEVSHSCYGSCFSHSLSRSNEHQSSVCLFSDVVPKWKQKNSHTSTVKFIFSTLSYVTDKENLFNNQELRELVIISLILTTINLIQGWYCMEKLDSKWGKGLKDSFAVRIFHWLWHSLVTSNLPSFIQRPSWKCMIAQSPRNYSY